MRPVTCPSTLSTNKTAKMTKMTKFGLPVGVGTEGREQGRVPRLKGFPRGLPSQCSRVFSRPARPSHGGGRGPRPSKCLFRTASQPRYTARRCCQTFGRLLGGRWMQSAILRIQPESGSGLVQAQQRANRYRHTKRLESARGLKFRRRRWNRNADVWLPRCLNNEPEAGCRAQSVWALAVCLHYCWSLGQRVVSDPNRNRAQAFMSL